MPAPCGWPKEPKLSKTIIAPLSCANEFASGTPETLYLDFSAEFIEKIHTLAAMVKEMCCVCVELAFHDALWSDADEIMLAEELGYENYVIPQDVDYDRLKEKVRESSNRVDAPVIRIYPERFTVSAMPRECGTDFTVSTKAIPLTLLAGAEPLNLFATDLQS